MSGTDIAIIGMAGRFPGADTVDHFWLNLRNGVDSLNTFESYNPHLDSTIENGGFRFVKANNLIADFDCFDSEFFNISDQEANLMDPQHRIFLETAWLAIEHAGYNLDELPELTGLYAGVYANYYLLRNIVPTRQGSDPAAELAITIGNEKDHLSTFTAYKLNLKGPVMSVQATCSSSLASVHLACESLLTYSSDMMLAGGVTISVPQVGGYLYQEGGLLSRDGKVHSFGKEASGTIYSNGSAVVVLKRLEDAQRDKDAIYAVIKGSAVNNDGSVKMGYTAPSVEAQVNVIKRALKIAGVDPHTVSYVEGHGTGTPLGDSIEIEALNTVFREVAPQTCALGSVKSNVGHLGPASGVSGLIKVCLALHHQQIPASLNCHTANGKLAEGGPFYINSQLKPWDSSTLRRACLSSFGLGGTNVHMVCEEAPAASHFPIFNQKYPFCLSAKNPQALQQMGKNLLQYLEEHPDLNPLNLAYTLLYGRKSFPCRFETVFSNLSDLSEQLKSSMVCQKEDAIEWHRDIDFTHAQRIPLPGYPFKKKKHWIEEPKATAVQETKESNEDITQQMIALWQRYLGADITDLEDNFFEKGGSSLSATSLVTAVEKEFGVKVELKDLFENPTVRSLTSLVMDKLLSSLDAQEFEALIGAQP